MIKLDELKTLLQDLIPDDKMAETIEKVVALDKYPEAGDAPGEGFVEKAKYDQLNAEWNARFKAAFFGGEPDQETKDAATGKPQDSPEDKSDPQENFTLEALLQGG